MSDEDEASRIISLLQRQTPCINKSSLSRHDTTVLLFLTAASHGGDKSSTLRLTTPLPSHACPPGKREETGGGATEEPGRRGSASGATTESGKKVESEKIPGWTTGNE